MSFQITQIMTDSRYSTNKNVTREFDTTQLTALLDIIQKVSVVSFDSCCLSIQYQSEDTVSCWCMKKRIHHYSATLDPILKAEKSLQVGDPIPVSIQKKISEIPELSSGGTLKVFFKKIES